MESLGDDGLIGGPQRVGRTLPQRGERRGPLPGFERGLQSLVVWDEVTRSGRENVAADQHVGPEAKRFARMKQCRLQTMALDLLHSTPNITGSIYITSKPFELAVCGVVCVWLSSRDLQMKRDVARAEMFACE